LPNTFTATKMTNRMRTRVTTIDTITMAATIPEVRAAPELDAESARAAIETTEAVELGDDEKDCKKGLSWSKLIVKSG
jgi:hypothetical protein